MSKIRARWPQRVLAVFRDSAWAATCPPLHDASRVGAIDAAGPLEWVDIVLMLEMISAASDVIGETLVISEYEHAADGLVSSPILSPLVEPLFRIFGRHTLPMVFPRAWAMITKDVAQEDSWVDERASWVRFDGLCETVRAHPLFSPLLVATTRSVVGSVAPGSDVWAEAIDGQLHVGVHNAGLRAG